MSEKRALKIQTFGIPGKQYRSKEKLYPSLLLKGKWLQELGFLPQTYVDVVCEDNQLIIRPFKTNRP
jgi:hypothetical protein